jgi:hypothetical protein
MTKIEIIEQFKTIQCIDKDVKETLVPQPWVEIAYFIHKYIIYEGKFSLLFIYNFKLLNHLIHPCYLNISLFCLSTLQNMEKNGLLQC